jgi:hypothetical protein
MWRADADFEAAIPWHLPEPSTANGCDDSVCGRLDRAGFSSLGILGSDVSVLNCLQGSCVGIMRSNVSSQLPSRVKRGLHKFGADISVARRKRHLTAAMMAERIGVAKSTYARMEKGDASVGMGAYAMALFVLGFGDALGDILDDRRDEHGLLLDRERLPKRIRRPKGPQGL